MSWLKIYVYIPKLITVNWLSRSLPSQLSLNVVTQVSNGNSEWQSSYFSHFSALKLYIVFETWHRIYLEIYPIILNL